VERQDSGAQIDKGCLASSYVGRNIKLIGWPVTQKEVWTKDRLTMSFLSFEDETGMYETVIFPQVYDKYHTLLFDHRPLIVYGKAVDDHGALTVEVGKIEVMGGKDGGAFFGGLLLVGIL
jgi:DNA polymerase-3 subunit alpha/error-prone DNA polymerase